MSSLTILRSYAKKSNPETLPPSVLLVHTPTSLTLFDAFPKSIFHFLILPRIRPPFTVFDLATLRTVLKCDRERAKDLLAGLDEGAKVCRRMIEDEMMKKYGFKWEIWTGFHGAPSMEWVALCSRHFSGWLDSTADMFICMYCRRTCVQRKWNTKNTIIHSIRSSDFFYTWTRSCPGLMQSLHISRQCVVFLRWKHDN